MTGAATVERSGVRLRFADGEVLRLPVERWASPPGDVELRVLDRAWPPLLDVGCGPGRMAQAAAERGWPSLGIDTAPTAVRTGRERGTSILERSVFDVVPAAGRWRTALLLDGSIGIGGDPRLLLGRIRTLLQRGGLVLAEVEPPGSRLVRLRARIEAGGSEGPWFRWARVGAEAAGALARMSGFTLEDLWEEEGERWFAAMAGL